MIFLRTERKITGRLFAPITRRCSSCFSVIRRAGGAGNSGAAIVYKSRIRNDMNILLCILGSWQELSNNVLVAAIGANTAENGPCKVWDPLEVPVVFFSES